MDYHGVFYYHFQGLVNVPIEHHPTIGDTISNRYGKVMFKIPNKGHVPTPDFLTMFHSYVRLPKGTKPRGFL